MHYIFVKLQKYNNSWTSELSWIELIARLIVEFLLALMFPRLAESEGWKKKEWIRRKLALSITILYLYYDSDIVNIL